ncbi:MAG: hypothetical protein PHR83_08355 [Paludibacter sp.]|nr:hypothetical protein [Paludibacter sp.]
MKKNSIFFKMRKLCGFSFLSLALLASTSAVAQDVTTGLQVYYTFNDVSGTSVPDHSSTTSNTGTIMGAPQTVVGNEGSALQFPLQADYLQLPNGLMSSVTDFTVAAWIKMDKEQWWPRIFDFGTGTDNYMFLAEVNTSAGFYQLRFAIRTAAINEQQINCTSNIAVGSWVHVAVTLNGNVGTMYVNGVAVATNTIMTLNPSSLGSTNLNYIAKSQFNDPGLAGSVDEFRVYNRALTANDVLSLTGLNELKNQQTALTLTNIDPVTTSKINLPLTAGTQGVTITWASSNKSMIDTLGNVLSRPSKYNTPVMLTATLSQAIGDKTYKLSKQFVATVVALNPVEADQIAYWNFASSNLSLDGDTIKVKDASESGFVGKIMDAARIRTIGNTTKYNVLDLGNSTGYFDMGTGIGEAVYSLSDKFTIGGYFRMDSTYTGAGDWGNNLFSFSNTVNDLADPKGTMYACLGKTNYAITSGAWNYGGETGINPSKTPSTGTWHHYAYVQDGNIGSIYFDTTLVSTGTIGAFPFNTLRRDGVTGTLFNWIGRPPYGSPDSYLRKTLVYGVDMYKIALTKTDMTTLLGVPDTLAALNKAYKENSDNISTALSTEMTHLTTALGNLSSVTSNLSLPAVGVLDNSITIKWTSTHEEIISLAGVVTQPNYHAYNVALTATMKTNTGQSLVKTFNATVPAKAGTAYNNDLLVKYDFASVTNDTIVTDAAEKHLTGIVKNGAKIRTIGTTDTGKFNVLALGDSIGYFDMGAEVGKLVYDLKDYTVCAYFRIDPNYLDTELAKNGNFLWSFSNALDILKPDYSGYLIGSLKNQAVTITPSNWSGEQTVKIGSTAMKGNWHHFAYTQKDSIGTVYIDGSAQSSGTVKQLPSNTLIKDQRLGTLYNWIGRSCYSGDVYLRKTLVTDLRLYKTVLTDLLTELDITNKTFALEAALSINDGTAVKAIDQNKYKVIANNGQLSIRGLVGGENVSIYDVTGHQLNVKATNMGTSTISVKSGVYIVRINDSAVKVVVL